MVDGIGALTFTPLKNSRSAVHDHQWSMQADLAPSVAISVALDK